MLKRTKRFLTDLWVLTRPYWFSEERGAALVLLAAVVGLNLGLVYVNVLINWWNKDFYDTLQNLDIHGFYQQLLRFIVLAASYIVMAVYQLYLNQMLQIRWRRWLTSTYLGAWISSRTYYRMQLIDSGTDNPDQRIADDLALFCDRTLNLTLGLLLHKPQWLFLDEATASLDDASEAHLYMLLRERLPNTTIISIGHRPTLAQFHEQRLRLERDEAGLGHLVPG